MGQNWPFVSKQMKVTLAQDILIANVVVNSNELTIDRVPSVVQNFQLLQRVLLHSINSSSSSTTDSSTDIPYKVGVPKPVHAKGTTETYNSAKKWVVAALKNIGKGERDLVLYPSREPNDPLGFWRKIVECQYSYLDLFH